MNLPFGLPVIKESVVKRRDELSVTAASYERKLAEYSEVLESYKKCIAEYSNRLESYGRKLVDNQLSIVQTALDITYIKEQEDKSLDLIEDIKNNSLSISLSNLDAISVAIADMNHKMGELDNAVEKMEENLAALEKKLDVLELNLEGLDKNFESLDKNMEGLDKNVVNRLSEYMDELQKQSVNHYKLLQMELMTGMEKISKSVKRGHWILWFSLLFNIFGIAAIVLLVLYNLGLLSL